MATQVNQLVSREIGDKSRKAVLHFIKEINNKESREDYAGFSSTYVSKIIAYVSWVEHDDRYAESLIKQHEESHNCLEVRFASIKSAETFAIEILKYSKDANSTVSSYFSAIQKWVDLIEHEDNYFCLSDSAIIKK